MDHAHPIFRQPNRLGFRFYTAQEIHAISVQKISHPLSLDDLGNPIREGLYDPRLGPLEHGKCETCQQPSMHCPGHFGHISLAVPVYHPMLLNDLVKCLNRMCVYCHRFLLSDAKKKLLIAKLSLLSRGWVIAALELEEKVTYKLIDETVGDDVMQDRLDDYMNMFQGVNVGNKASEYRKKWIDELTMPKKCSHCGAFAVKFKKEGESKVFEVSLSGKALNIMQQKGVKKRESLFKKIDEDDEEEGGQEEENEEIQTNNLKQNFVTTRDVMEHCKLFWNNEKDLCKALYSKNSSNSNNNYEMFFLTVLPVTPCRFRPMNFMDGKMLDHPSNQYYSSILKLNGKIIELNQLMKQDGHRLELLVQTWVAMQDQVNWLMDSSKGKGPSGIKQVLEKKDGLFRKHMMGKRVNYAARSVISPDPNLKTSEIGIPLVFAQKLTYPERVTTINAPVLRHAVIRGNEMHPGASAVEDADGTLHQLDRLTVEQRTALANQLLNSNGSSKKVHRHLRTGDVLLVNRQPTLHKPSIMSHVARVLQDEKTIRMHYANCNTYNADFDGDEMNLHFPQNELARAEAYGIANTDNQYLVPTDGQPLRGLIQDHVVAGVLLTLVDTFLDQHQYHQLLFSCLYEQSNKIILLPPAIIKPVPKWSGKQVISTILANLTIGRAPLNLTSKAKIPARMWGSREESSTVTIMDGHLVNGVLDKSQFGATSFGLVHSVYEVYGASKAGELLTMLGRLFTKYLQIIGFTCRMDDLVLTASCEVKRRELIESSFDLGRIAFQEHEIKDFEKIIRSDDKMASLDSVFKGVGSKVTSEIIDHCLPHGQLRPFPKNNMALMTLSGAKGSNVNFSQISGLLGQQELEGRRVPMMVSGRTLPCFSPWDTSLRAGGHITQRFLTGIRPQEYFFHCMAGREGLIDTAVKTSRSGYLQRCLVKHLEGIVVQYDHTVRDADGSVLQFNYGEDSLDVIKQKHLFQFDFIESNISGFLQKGDIKIMDQMMQIESSTCKRALKQKLPPILSTHSPSQYLGSVSEKFQRQLTDYLKQRKNNLTNNNLSNNNTTSITDTMFKCFMWIRYNGSLVDAGESVGVLAAQSVGEPSTQMTLNTFHFAGFGAKNVTLGIPRLREIIMTASKSIKTPTMTCKVLNNPKRVQEIFNKWTLYDSLKDIKVTQGWRMNGNRFKNIVIELYLEDGDDVGLLVKCVCTKFSARLSIKLKQALKIRKKIDIEQGKAVVEDGNIEKDDDEDRIGLNETEKSDDEKSDDEDNDEDNEEDNDEEQEEQDKNYNKNDEIDESLDNDDDKINKVDNQTFNSPHDFIHKIQVKNSIIKVFVQLPCDSPKILFLEMVQEIVKKCVIHEVKGIETCHIEEDKGVLTMMTQGCNLHGAWDAWDLLDITRLYSNDIHAILTVYGVEAARAALVQEIAAVFNVYGISVDPRHLYLIADYMTFEGGYKPFNRMGIDSNSSPLLKMSFETTYQFLKNAALLGDEDSLCNPSARIVMGLGVGSGTGAFELLQPL